MNIVLQVAKVSGKQKLIFRLAGRSCCNAEEASKLALALPTATLGDIRRHGGRGLSQVGGESEALVGGEATTVLVDVKDETMGLCQTFSSLKSRMSSPRCS
jgi:hypothetical protein